MRIIAGQYKGRILASPKKASTHPMSEKLRGAIFAALGDIEGLSLLDAYSGSGAIGFEALSRGAKHVTAVEADKTAYATIRSNAHAFNLADHDFKAVHSSVESWLATTKDSFDLIIADPPYDKVKDSTMLKLTERLNKTGVLILSLPPDHSVDLAVSGLKLVKAKHYGDAQALFFKF